MKWHDSSARFPNDRELLGRYLGPASNIGPIMTAKILKSNGEIRNVSTYRGLTEEEKDRQEAKEAMKAFDETIMNKLGAKLTEGDLLELGEDFITSSFPHYSDEYGNDLPPMPEDMEEEEKLDIDNYIGAEVLMDKGESMQTAKVVSRKRGRDGSSIGIANPNPMLDTRIYVVRYPDGIEEEYSANIIAQNLYSQCDLDGNQNMILKYIVDHRILSDSVRKGDEYFETANGTRRLRKSTRGWELCIEWIDGSTSWEKLIDTIYK